jgi:microcystin-dependent protein
LFFTLDWKYDMPPGTILAFAAPALPTGWLRCDGSAIGRIQYKNLFQAIGTTYGVGDHITTFNLPDCRGRALVGIGQGPALTNRPLGQSFGAEKHTLSVNELTAHSHVVNDIGHVHNIGNPDVGQVWETAGGRTGRFAYGVTNHGVKNNPPTMRAHTGVSLQATGSSAPHNNIQPSLAINYIIKY